MIPIFRLLVIALFLSVCDPVNAEIEVFSDGENFYMREAKAPPFDCLRWSVRLGHEFFPADKWLTITEATALYNWPVGTETEQAVCKKKFFSVAPYRDSLTRPLYQLEGFTAGTRKVIGRVDIGTPCETPVIYRTTRSEYHAATFNGMTGVAICSD